jgi:hypothetical protein
MKNQMINPLGKDYKEILEEKLEEAQEEEENAVFEVDSSAECVEPACIVFQCGLTGSLIPQICGRIR